MKPIASNTVFHVSDLDKSLDFYTNILGFELDFKFGEPATYAGLSFGDVRIHLSSSYPYKNNTGHGSIYLSFSSVDDIYHQLLKDKVEFYSHIETREYGMRDFAIKDPDGNQIGYGAAV
jgi:catechol 2,3-dioxygenase-like lactoylglutathione lyase family enzyme